MVLYQLIAYLSPYMLYKCVHIKFGAALYRTGVYIITSLLWALGTLCYNEVYDEFNHIQNGQRDIKYKERVITEAGHILNDLLRKGIMRQSSSELQIKY